MPLYRCTKCGCVENTALGGYWFQQMRAAEAKTKHEPLCSECDPSIGAWHGRWEKKSALGYNIGADGYLYADAEVPKVHHTKMVGRVE